MAGYLLGRFFPLAVDAGFAATPLVASATELLAQPQVWVVALSCGLAALVGSAVVGRGSVAAGIAAQIIGCAIVVAGIVYAARMENGGMWAAPDAPTIVCAVSLTI
jgi:serine/threonine-protein kinase